MHHLGAEKEVSLYLGGMDTIRGFRSGELVGDRGFYSRNDIAWTNLPVWHDGRIKPYVFLDAGKASLMAVSDFSTLAGVGASMRAQWQWHQRVISGELTVGRALTQPASLGPKATLVLGTANLNFLGGTRCPVLPPLSAQCASPPSLPLH
ncbi:ShlB/FhaC/HecB family hemolysin secretion/activation protein [Paraburkholderia graminis]|uniref:ShlB/FhaC/HecB family hemolysin secretion/activation protein n=1 Tax=Paraburkholderia graminis TaxID=60548 RepID=UPI0038BB5DA9